MLCIMIVPVETVWRSAVHSKLADYFLCLTGVNDPVGHTVAETIKSL